MGRVELGLGEDVHPLARPAQPVEEVEVVATKMRRHAAVEEGPVEAGGVEPARGIPGVSPAVVVVVPEVVRLPGACREYDCHPVLAEVFWRDDKRRVADSANKMRSRHRLRREPGRCASATPAFCSAS